MPQTPVTTIKLGDSQYSKLLAQISDPSEILYCRGNLELLNTPCLSVVGTRKITPYGKESASYITAQLASAGFTIVSGLALGIDAVAHQTALDSNGKTIAVLGTGIKNLWPKENERLGLRIINEGGLVVSELPDTMPGAKHTFPMRNRIISGLSRGVVIIEADKQSGALITAKSALEQNRDVFAVPGNIFSPRSIGPNMLIQQGAKLVLTPQDILEEYKDRQEVFNQLKPNLSTANPVEEKILAILKSNGPMYLDEIIAKSELEPSKIMATVSILEIRSVIKHIGNGTYKICS